MRIDVAADSNPTSISFDRSQTTRRRQARHKIAVRSQPTGDSKSSYEMTDDVKRYWFVVAVLREPSDLATTIGDLHARNYSSGELLVLANHRAGDLRRAIQGRNGGSLNVFVPGGDGDFVGEVVGALPNSLSTLLHAMEQDALSGQSHPVSDDGQVPSPVYSQLLEDVAAGAIVLIASAAGPEQQLRGARVLLRGNCECVLMHEITARGS
jgi:hypothetical protein